MKKMAKELNQTFIVVTHDRKQFGDVDRIITVKDGHVFEGEHMEQMEVTI
jgi:lipoprotein-releasing system ATP-binding protein